MAGQKVFGFFDHRPLDAGIVCGVKRSGMILYTTDSLFAWNRLDDSPDLKLVRDFFAQLPDGALLEALQQHRGKGRDDCPLPVLWFCVVLQRLLRHPTMRLTLDELRRNQDLRRLGGMDSPAAVPEAWNISRFLAVLGREPFCVLLREVFEGMVTRLGAAVPDLGQHAAGDATHLNARTRGQYAAASPRPDGGRKEYVDGDGQVTRVLEWFGYKLHLLCDTRHEVALAYRITPASAADNTQIADLVAAGQAVLPPKRMRTLAYDKAADDGAVHEALQQAGVRPVIQQRNLWKGEAEQALSDLGIGNVVHDEAGTIFCYDMLSDPPVRHRMAYIGHEPARGTLKYRCPAEHEGWRCPCAARCNAGKRYGMTVRVKQELDLRRFPPIPRATKQFERLYKGRTACERVNSRLKVFWGLDDGNVAGGASFQANVGVVMLVHIGLAMLLAKAPRRDPNRRLGQTRLSPIAQALHAT
jgi:hypothetical protein